MNYISNLYKSCFRLKYFKNSNKLWVRLFSKDTSNSNNNKYEEEHPFSRVLKVLGKDFYKLGYDITGNESYLLKSKFFPRNCDVLILGGGLLGSSIACELQTKARDGLSILLIDNMPMNTFIHFPSNCTEKAYRLRKVIFLPEQWQYITDQLTEREKLINDAEKENSIRKQRHLHSLDISRDWPTSLINIYTKQINERQNRQDIDKKLRDARAETIAKEFDIEKQRFINNCKMELFSLRDSSKDANSALYLAETLRQREEQIKLNKEIKAKEIEREKTFANKIIENDINAIKEMKLSKKCKYLKEKEYREELFEEIQKRKQHLLNEKEKKIKSEIQDIKFMEEELELIKLSDKAIQEKESKIQKMNYEHSLQNKKNAKECKRLEEIDDERFRLAVENSIRDMATLKKFHEEEDRIRKNQKIDRVCKLIKSSEDERDAFESRILQRDLARQEKLEIKKNNELEQYRKKLVTEIIDIEREFRVKDRLDKKEEKEKILFHLQDRFHEVEEMENDKKEEFEKRKLSLLQRRHILQTQIDEKKKKDKKDNEEYRVSSIEDWDSQDKEFFTYIDEMIEDAKKKNRPLYPFYKTKEEYKIKNNLNPRPSIIELSRHTRSRIPFGPPCPPLLEILPCLSVKKL